MKIMGHNDSVIRSVSAFKKYNNVLSEVVDETYCEVKSHLLEKPIFCGVFTAKIYIGQKIIGTYQFDCRHFKRFMECENFVPKVTRVK